MYNRVIGKLKLIKVICPDCYFTNLIKDNILRKIDIIQCNKCNTIYEKECFIIVRKVK